MRVTQIVSRWNVNVLALSGLVALSVSVTFAPLAIAKGPDPAESGSAYNERGYNRDSVYAGVDVGAINAFNFNFSFDLPINIGLTYPENADVSLQVRMTYNSRVAHWQNRPRKRKFLRIRRQNPFGVGFDVNLGRIIATYGPVTAGDLTYVDASGAMHKLFPYASDERRTHDGSHIRAVYNAATPSWTVSFPDGLVQVLEHHVDGPAMTDLSDALGYCSPFDPPLNVETDPPMCPEAEYTFVPDSGLGAGGFDRDYVGWHVTKVYTRKSTSGAANPSYTVTYYGQDPANTAEAPFKHIIKSITDQHGRTIEFRLDPVRGVIDQITTPAPPAEGGEPRSAVHLLEYDFQDVVVGTSSSRFRRLTRISGPEVGPNQRYVHQFTYRDLTTSGRGELESIKYPSGRLTTIHYNYYPYLNGSPGNCSGETPDPTENACYGPGGGTCAHSWGVDRIDTFLDGDPNNSDDGNQLTTTFQQSTAVRDTYSGPEHCPTGSYQRFDQLHTMIDPAGNATVFRFRTPKEHGESKFHGLLVDEMYYGGNGTGSRKVKEIHYAYSEDCTTCDDYAELDTSGDYNADFEMVPDKIITRWPDDENDLGGPLPYVTTMMEERSYPDNFGHHQRVKFSGTAVGDSAKIVITDYANDNSIGSIGGNGCAVQSLEDNWLGDVVSSEEVRSWSPGMPEIVESRTEYGFDGVRGLRTSEIHRNSVSGTPDYCSSSPTTQSLDMVTEFHYVDSGDLEWERHYSPGLDPANAPTDVKAWFTYRYGARESGKNDAFGYYRYSRVIDASSGLPLAQREFPTTIADTSAVTTTFGYDILGRTTRISRGTDAPIVITYENVAATSSPQPYAQLPSYAVTLARIRSTQGAGIDSTESVDHFVAGRLDHEEKLNPDGSRAFRYTSYNGSGRVSFVTEWTRQSMGAGAPRTATFYAVFDANHNYLFEEPFGRPTTIIGPVDHVTSIRYFGLNKETTVQRVAIKDGVLDLPLDVMTREYTDALGRLRVVSKPVVTNSGLEAVGATGAGAYYDYDVFGRMTAAHVSATASVAPTVTDRYNASASGTQLRSWGYDKLGRMVTSTTPEAGTFTNFGWNALGQVTDVRDAAGAIPGYYHHTTYDAAGRPTKLERFSDEPAADLPSSDSAWIPSSASPNSWRTEISCFGTGISAWTIDDPSSCRYAQGANGIQTATLDSTLIAIKKDSFLTFKMYREVRANGGNCSACDTLSVLISNGAGWIELYRVDSTQVSWNKWVPMPAIALGNYAGSSRVVRFQFDSGGHNDNTMPFKGIAIRDMKVRRPASVRLNATTYDQTFSLPGNLALGKPTTIAEYDYGKQVPVPSPVFQRTRHYVDSNGRLSKEKLIFDWDRDGAVQTLYQKYGYDSRGALESRTEALATDPDIAGSAYRTFHFQRSHGAITRAYTQHTDGAIKTFVPSISYNDAGSMSQVSFQNGATQHIDTNAAFLPSRIYADHGDTFYDTGDYRYDGALNIVQIGPDYYRYDADNRLTWARVESTSYGTVDLDQAYDEYGNMTAQNGAAGVGYPSLPDGLVFAGRTYTNNRIASAGFESDANGNLVTEPAHDGLDGQSYSYASDGRLDRVTNGAGVWFQSALYEGGDRRWFRSLWAEGGSALITVRDAFGDVVADFTEQKAGEGLKLDREYVRLNGQLMAINSTCGPRPSLELTGADDNNVFFHKNNFGATAVGSYSVSIRGYAGQSKVILLPESLADSFSIPRTEFYPGVTNWIQIQVDASCGHTGYSNAVAYGLSAGGPPMGCLHSMAASRTDITVTGSSLKLAAVGTCPVGTLYNVYYYDQACECATKLNGVQPTATPSKVLSNVPCGSGMGEYWVTPIDPETGEILEASPVVSIDGTSCSSGGLGINGEPIDPPGVATMNAQYVHWDHLGSTRAITDEQGAVNAAYKYFPFGMEADTSEGDGLRQKFTGHERDDRVRLDYMFARHHNSSLGRFMCVDTAGLRINDPQSWNRYSYVGGNPLNFVDPNGKERIKFNIVTRIVAPSVTALFLGVPPIRRYAGGVKSTHEFTIETDPTKSARPVLTGQTRDVGESQRVDSSGHPIGPTAQAPNTAIVAYGGRDNTGTAVVTATGTLANPLVPGAPPITYNFTITPAKSGSDFTFQGTYGGYPTARVTATNEAGQTVTVYEFNEADALMGPVDLFPVIGDQVVSKSCAFGADPGCQRAPK